MQNAFADMIHSHADSLTPSERRLVTLVMAQPRNAALATVTDLARGAGVHEATVSRLARKLGYEGFPAFRAALQAEFLPTEETATRLKRTLDSSAAAGVLATLVEGERAALAGLLRHVGEAEIADAARRLMAARRLFVFGRGNAEALALTMAKRFLRFGRDVRLLTGDARNLAEGVLGMAEGDALLIYAFRRTPRRYAALVDQAHAAGVTVIVISDTTGHVLAPMPDLLLSAPRSADEDGFQTLTVPMAISNAIIIAAGATDDARALQILEKLGSLIKRFE